MKETKDNKILQDENGKVQFDFSNALGVFEPHELASMYSEYISDVDFVIEEEQRIICLEYKNASVKNAANAEVFQRKLVGEEFWKRVAKKFYGTVFLVWACNKNQVEKPIEYILLIETNPSMDDALKKRFTTKMMRQLPFKYGGRAKIKRKVINRFELVDLKEWNAKYPRYPVCEMNSAV